MGAAAAAAVAIGRMMMKVVVAGVAAVVGEAEEVKKVVETDVVKVEVGAAERGVQPHPPTRPVTNSKHEGPWASRGWFLSAWRAW